MKIENVLAQLGGHKETLLSYADAQGGDAKAAPLDTDRAWHAINSMAQPPLLAGMGEARSLKQRRA